MKNHNKIIQLSLSAFMAVPTAFCMPFAVFANNNEGTCTSLHNETIRSQQTLDGTSAPVTVKSKETLSDSMINGDVVLEPGAVLSNSQVKGHIRLEAGPADQQPTQLSNVTVVSDQHSEDPAINIAPKAKAALNGITIGANQNTPADEKAFESGISIGSNANVTADNLHIQDVTRAISLDKQKNVRLAVNGDNTIEKAVTGLSANNSSNLNVTLNHVSTKDLAGSAVSALKTAGTRLVVNNSLLESKGNGMDLQGNDNGASNTLNIHDSSVRGMNGIRSANFHVHVSSTNKESVLAANEDEAQKSQNTVSITSRKADTPTAQKGYSAIIKDDGGSMDVSDGLFLNPIAVEKEKGTATQKINPSDSDVVSMTGGVFTDHKDAPSTGNHGFVSKDYDVSPTPNDLLQVGKKGEQDDDENQSPAAQNNANQNAVSQNNANRNNDSQNNGNQNTDRQDNTSLNNNQNPFSQNNGDQNAVSQNTGSQYADNQNISGQNNSQNSINSNTVQPNNGTQVTNDQNTVSQNSQALQVIDDDSAFSQDVNQNGFSQNGTNTNGIQANTPAENQNASQNNALNNTQNVTNGQNTQNNQNAQNSQNSQNNSDVKTVVPSDNNTANHVQNGQQTTSGRHSERDNTVTSSRTPVTDKNNTTKAPVANKNNTTKAPVTSKNNTTKAPVTNKNNTTKAPVTSKNNTTKTPAADKNSASNQNNASTKKGEWKDGRYYVNDEMQTGWKTIDGKKYFFDRNGKPLTGYNHIIDDMRYNFNTRGELISQRPVKDTSADSSADQTAPAANANKNAADSNKNSSSSTGKNNASNTGKNNASNTGKNAAEAEKNAANVNKNNASSAGKNNGTNAGKNAADANKNNTPNKGTGAQDEPEPITDQNLKPVEKNGTWNVLKDGKKQFNTWYHGKLGSSKDQWSYFGEDGKLVKGWKQITYNGKPQWFYFDQNGAMKKGLEKVDDNHYDFGRYGAMQTGWQKLGENNQKHWYYFDKAGHMITGWKYLDYWHFDDNGVWTNTPAWYYFQKDGKMLADTEMGQYRFDSAGICLNPEA